MRVDRASLEEMSAATGFHSGTLEKVVRLGELLADVRRHPLLSLDLVLKGGTPLNLGFGPPARLSVDVDFNFVGALEREAMLVARPEVERALETIARAEGYALQKSADAHAGRKLYLGYRNVNGGADRIEIDVNDLHRSAFSNPSGASSGGQAARPSRRPSWLPKNSSPASCVLFSHADFLATCSMQLAFLRSLALAGFLAERAGCSSR